MGWLPMRAVERIIGLATDTGCNTTDVSVPDVKTALRSLVAVPPAFAVPTEFRSACTKGLGRAARERRTARKIRSDNALLRCSVQLEAFRRWLTAFFQRIVPRARD